MKRNDNYILRQVADEHILFPGSPKAKLPGKVTLSESAVMIWNLLAADQTLPQLVSAITEEYDVPEEIAEQDICELLGHMRKLELVLS